MSRRRTAVVVGAAALGSLVLVPQVAGSDLLPHASVASTMNAAAAPRPSAAAPAPSAAAPQPTSQPTSQPTLQPTPRPTPGSRSAGRVAYRTDDPSTWSDRQLAAQLTYTCVNADDPARARAHAALGVGGVTLLGNKASSRLKGQLSAVRAAAPQVVPYVGGDEEGGAVQRLSRVIYPLPSAKTMGTWSPARIEGTAYRYGRRMAALGVTMDFGPVADVAVPGYYMDSLRRAFSSDPAKVARANAAWMRGMQRAGVVPVVKHWPGHGQTRNSHTAAARVPKLATLRTRDLLPFEAAFRAGAPAVMVGHLTSAGLTEKKVPASESPRALRYLRSRTGPDTVIVTDSLSMAAASRALGITPATAAVRSLEAGADWALVCSYSAKKVVGAVQKAIASGSLPRSRAVASVGRILALKKASGLLTASPTAAELTTHRDDRPRPGQTGPSVTLLQRALQLPPDGRFGTRTRAVLRRFQADHGLPSDGRVTPATWDALARDARRDP